MKWTSIFNKIYSIKTKLKQNFTFLHLQKILFQYDNTLQSEFYSSTAKMEIDFSAMILFLKVKNFGQFYALFLKKFQRYSN